MVEVVVVVMVVKFCNGTDREMIHLLKLLCLKTLNGWFKEQNF